MILPLLTSLIIRVVTLALSSVLSLVEPRLAVAGALYLVAELKIRSLVIRLRIQKGLDQATIKPTLEIVEETTPVEVPTALHRERPISVENTVKVQLPGKKPQS